jgi:hypothetical protein
MGEMFRFANECGVITTTKNGAIPALSTPDEVHKHKLDIFFLICCTFFIFSFSVLGLALLFRLLATQLKSGFDLKISMIFHSIEKDSIQMKGFRSNLKN